MLVLVAALSGLACTGARPTPTPTGPLATAAPSKSNLPTATPTKLSVVDYVTDITFTLQTAIADGGLRFIGVGGDIDGLLNPTLNVAVGQTAQITLVNGDGAEHDIVAPDLGSSSDRVIGKGASTSISFLAGAEGEFSYWCSVPGHRAAGMEGLIIVGEGGGAVVATGADITRDPTDLPPPVGDRGPMTVEVELETVEVLGQLADGTTFKYWTFNGLVPGPMVRVREGDDVHLTLKNAPGNLLIHSIDLHAVTGPGGGAAVTQVAPGSDADFTFKALKPGLYVYHCATPSVAHHISSGMYGMILVEPEGGLPPVDHEFYVMQGEIYTQQPFGTKGLAEFDHEKLLNEQPEYFVLNGAAAALASDAHAMHANVGETVRIYFGVGGPNFTSSFHVIGEIFDTVYDEASLMTPPLEGVQTTLVPPGGATVVEFRVEYPGRYILVDHALSRLERGLVGFLYVEGEADPAIFNGEPSGISSGH
jgi:nitrite reductase (NO-forming)